MQNVGFGLHLRKKVYTNIQRHWKILALATGDEYDVSFLGYPHRHIFHFRVAITVTHNDRDIEFIQFKRWLEKLYAEKTLELDYKSCEMMSDDLFDKISEKYPGREVKIEVSEDGENGALIEYGIPIIKNISKKIFNQ